MSFLLLDAVSSTGASSSINLTHANPSRHSVQVLMAGTVVATAVTVALEGSLDGVTWFALATHALDAGEITAEGSLFHVVDRVVAFIRANLTVLTGGTSPTISVQYISDRRATS